MHVLVTGGCGYVGAHVVRALQKGGHDVTVLDDLSSGHPSAVGDADLVRGDVRDSSLVGRLMQGVDAVVHLAALKDGAASLAEPSRYFSVNVEGSRVLLESAAASGVGLFIFSSSCAVYGQPHASPVDETAPLQPSNPYGESKAIVERMLPWFEQAGGPAWTCLRYFNAAGADSAGDIGEHVISPANLVPRAMAALEGRLGPLEIFGTDYDTPDGTAIRDYVHVTDIADAHVRAIEHLAGGGRSVTLNLGTGRGASVREVLDLIGRAAGRPVPVVPAPRRKGDPAAIWASADRARDVLGWRPAFDLEAMMASAWTWHSTHPHGYGRAMDGTATL